MFKSLFLLSEKSISNDLRFDRDDSFDQFDSFDGVLYGHKQNIMLRGTSGVSTSQGKHGQMYGGGSNTRVLMLAEL